MVPMRTKVNEEGPEVAYFVLYSFSLHKFASRGLEKNRQDRRKGQGERWNGRGGGERGREERRREGGWGKEGDEKTRRSS